MKKNVKTKKEVVLILTTLQWSTMEEWQYQLTHFFFYWQIIILHFVVEISAYDKNFLAYTHVLLYTRWIFSWKSKFNFGSRR